MAYDFSEFDTKVKETKEWLTHELSILRTGRATPALIEKVTVDSYGAQTQLTHVATVSVEDAKTLRLNIWDKANIGPTQTAIEKANLGVSVAPDDSGLRVIFPDVTQENRQSTVKIVKAKLEEAKIALRRAREEAGNDIQKQEQNKEISEDERFTYKDELQKKVDVAGKEFDEMAQTKEKEILGA